jgi:hypothetical protein
MWLASLAEISGFDRKFNQRRPCERTTGVVLELNPELFLVRLEDPESPEAMTVLTRTFDPVAILPDLCEIKLVPILRNRIRLDLSHHRFFGSRPFLRAN